MFSFFLKFVAFTFNNIFVFCFVLGWARERVQSVKLLSPNDGYAQNLCKNPDMVVKWEAVTGSSLEGCLAKFQAIKRLKR